MIMNSLYTPHSGRGFGIYGALFTILAQDNPNVWKKFPIIEFGKDNLPGKEMNIKQRLGLIASSSSRNIDLSLNNYYNSSALEIVREEIYIHDMRITK